MTTTNQSTERRAIGKELAAVTARATFSAQDDVSDWVLFNGNMNLSATGPDAAATVAVERSTVDPSGGAPNTVEVDDVTGNPSTVGLTLDIPFIGNAWYRAKNKATFGPATSVTERSLLSLEAAINGLQAEANGFFPGTEPQPLVHASVGDTALKMNLTAATPGVAGNSIATTDTLGDGSFGNATLTGGVDLTAATGTLTFVDVPDPDMTVTLGDLTYTFVAALTGGAYEVVIGGTIEETRDNLLDAINGEGTPAAGTLTANANPAAGTTLRLGSFIYTFVAALTGAPRQVKIGVSASATLDNLIAAINSGAGADSVYTASTPPNPDATAAAGTGDTMDVTAAYAGLASNEVVTTGSGSDIKATGTLTFTPGTITTQTIRLGASYYIFAADVSSDPLADGSSGHPWQVKVGASNTISLANLAAAINATGTRGTTYSYALAPDKANASAEATASDATTVSARARAAGTGGNSVATTVPSGAGFAWGATTLQGGGASLTWGASTLEDGTGSGVTYSDDVEANPLADAEASSTDALVATALAGGADGNDIESTDTLTDVFAEGTLTLTPGSITTQTIKIGSTYYIWAADPTTDALADGTVTHPWQVYVGISDTEAFANMVDALNATGTPGTTYSTALTAHPTVEGVTSDATTMDVQARSAGAAGNSIATTVPSGAGLAWGGATLSGGGGSWSAATLLGGLDAVAATGTLTMTDVPADGETVTVGDITYTFMDDPADPGDVLVASTTMDVVLTGQQISNL